MAAAIEVETARLNYEVAKAVSDETRRAYIAARDIHEKAVNARLDAFWAYDKARAESAGKVYEWQPR